MGFAPTEEQKRIFHFVKNRDENLLINAYAGAGKTTTIVEAVKLIDNSKSITFLAYNKHIQEELKTKLPEHVRCYTTYGLGNAAIMRKYGDKIKLDEFKIDKIINKKSKSWDLSGEFKTYEEIKDYQYELKKMVNLCRLTITTKLDYMGYVADRYEIRLSKNSDFKRVLKVLDEATTDRSTFDFVDMVYLPAIDNSIWMFPQDYVFVDEIQDINRCQVKIIEKILKKDKLGKTIGRLIVIGDKMQNIYGFNGTGDKTFDYFENYPNIKTLTLTYSFRCAKNIIKYANEIVPDIKALDTAPDGIVREGDVINEVTNGDMVLCRTTMPLVKLFFNLIVDGKRAIIRGGDIGVNLIELIGDLKTTSNIIDHWELELEKYRQNLRKMGILNPNDHSGYVALEDKVTTLLFLAKLSKDAIDLKNKITKIFSNDNGDGIILSTVHKAKGSESDRVFIIRPDLMPLPNSHGWQYGQEMNLKYVAVTRARYELIIDKVFNEEDRK